jgi:dCTP deaminase
MAVLSKPEILKHLKAGNIVIDPFHKENFGNTSYDVRLGQYFFRQENIKHTQTINPFWEKSIIGRLYPRCEQAVAVKEIKSETNSFHNLSLKDRVILVGPGETILAHTIEFIGGRNGTATLPAITSEMRARSSLGRIGIAVCKCAGWGDVGYVNRWTMEITNLSTVIIPLVVGMRVAQIIFHEVTPVASEDLYHQAGKYQTTVDIGKLKKSWQPEDMLPRLYKDRDIGKFAKYSKEG